MAPFEALYEKKCRSPLCCDDSSVAVVLGPELVQESIEQVRLISQKLEAAQDRQKTYASLRHRPIEFEADVFEVEPNLSYEERLVPILERQEKRLRNKVVPLVWVLWRSQKFEQETWKTEASMRERHPHLFE
ncbi:uncharacterized protein LOC141649366 [Silene latifolia]|uniref:uncharacterized protein LOC141649366 n=1 Tax=Silene latifolia TaxID=37657 RepID=UPI003D78976C